MIQTEMNAYEGQINLKLLGSIVSFTAQAASATQSQKNDIRRRCIFSNYPADPNVMQEEYGFLYLGELLERYEERFGMTPQDRRAIALALGYTREMSAPVRFCSFSPNRECRKVAGKRVQPLNNYTCHFRPSSLKQADKSGLDGLQAGK